MLVKNFSYHLPASRIAQKPVKPRDSAKLLVLNRKTGSLAHYHFYDLPKLLRPGDVLVFNNSKVIKAQLWGRKDTGGKIEVFLIKPIGGRLWEVIIGGRGAAIGRHITFGKKLSGLLIGRRENVWKMKFNISGKKFAQIISQVGEVPLPPYIKTRATLADYQTIFAKVSGSVAAPTAGLHFTKKLITDLKAKGIQIEYATLHVGLGTFQPVKTKRVQEHNIHSEFAEINAATAKRLNRAKKSGRRIIGVGTTAVRTLEAFSTPAGNLRAQKRDVNIFIYPGYKFKFVDAMITNFHLPESSLLMLVSAFAGRDKILRAYRVAIRSRYRFYSFGDGMLIK